MGATPTELGASVNGSGGGTPPRSLGSGRAAAKGTPRPGRSGGRGTGKAAQAPNKKLLAILGVVAVVAVGRFALPSLAGGGGGSHPTPPPVVAGRHLVPLGAAPAPTATGKAVQVGRPARNPFVPAGG